AAGPAGGRLVPGRLLPFRLGRQPLAGPPRVGVRLVPADVLHRFVARPRLHRAEPGPPPPVAAPLPGLGGDPAGPGSVPPAPRRAATGGWPASSRRADAHAARSCRTRSRRR